MWRRCAAALATFAGLTSVVSTASAADLPFKGPVYVPPPIFSWTGFYIGAHAGYGWSTWKGGGDSVDGNGWLGGLQLGYNYQMGNIVLGLEGDASYADVKKQEDGFFPGATATLKNDYYATVAGRIGYAFNRVLVYGKGGVAFTRDKWDINDGAGGTATGSFNRTGWMLGAGVEYALWNHWSVKAEYNYLDFGSKSETLTTGGGLVLVPPTVDVSLKTSLVKLGLNYRFY